MFTRGYWPLPTTQVDGYWTTSKWTLRKPWPRKWGRNLPSSTWKRGVSVGSRDGFLYMIEVETIVFTGWNHTGWWFQPLWKNISQWEGLSHILCMENEKCSKPPITIVPPPKYRVFCRISGVTVSGTHFGWEPPIPFSMSWSAMWNYMKLCQCWSTDQSHAPKTPR